MTPINVVIINQNQREWIECMSEAVKDYKHVFVLDRCTDDSEAVCKSLNENYIINSKGKGFLAGRMRNLGLAALGEEEHTLFLDGDRVPVNTTQYILEEALFRYDITLMRINNDPRPFSTKFCYNAMFGQARSHVYSCAMLIRREIIKQIQGVQDGHLFSKKFDGVSAGEDEYLGAVAHSIGATCGMFPSSCYVTGDTFKTRVDSSAVKLYKDMRDRISKEKLKAEKAIR